jgi:site-specific DNA-methyltransferase (adenine-specific)
MARKPLSEKTIVENVLKHGTGAIDIDGCRIPTSEGLNGGAYSENKQDNKEWGTMHKFTGKEFEQPEGRFPANILCTDDALNDGVITKSTGGKGEKSLGGLGDNVYGKYAKAHGANAGGLGDSGSKSRYFDIDAWGEKNGLLQFPKASKSERGSYNNHPTVKPIHLMSYLIRLVTPKGGIVLDPFGGSGTTACSAIKCGYGYVIIEKEQNHVEIINKRISEYSGKPNQPNLFESLL